VGHLYVMLLQAIPRSERKGFRLRNRGRDLKMLKCSTTTKFKTERQLYMVLDLKILSSHCDGIPSKAQWSLVWCILAEFNSHMSASDSNRSPLDGQGPCFGNPNVIADVFSSDLTTRCSTRYPTFTWNGISKVIKTVCSTSRIAHKYMYTRKRQ
jgi:hypothetical protein